MLGNRYWAFKFILPLLLLAGMCLHALWQLPKVRPMSVHCLAHPTEYEGRVVWTGSQPVLESTSEGFTLRAEGKILRVQSDLKPAAGRWVVARGIFRAPDLLVAQQVKDLGRFPLHRRSAYGVSFAVLAVWLWFFLKRFRLGLRGGLFHPKP
ncbi:MAG: hypothetical protein HYY16_04345 [Planctomycetes bacterium]|nr:hypothetical protein [Planctomycetota bacterium]